MTIQLQDAYIVAATRTPVAKRKGMFRHVRPDDMLAHVLRAVTAQAPGLDLKEIGDVIVGCAIPEGEQGMNVARIGSLLAGLPDSVPAYTINRFCSSGLNAVALAADRIRMGEADVMIAAGTESMSVMPQMMGNKVAINPGIFANENVAIAYGMGLTAEKVAQRWQVSRADQDAFAAASHAKAVAAIAAGHFQAEITPYLSRSSLPDFGSGALRLVEKLCADDEGPRAEATAESLAKLRPVFAAKGSVTAGNASQMSDGAAAVLLMSEAALKRYNLQPLARFVSFAVAGVPAEILDWIELNEAFAAQALAVARSLDMDAARINPLGGAIALGHPLGATGAIRTATLVHGLRRSGGKYGMVSMCIGTGMGAAGVLEVL